MVNLLISIMPLAFIAVLFYFWYKKVEYRCEYCYAVIRLPISTMILIPLWMIKKPVVCPHCGMRTWATPIRKENPKS